MSAPRILVIKTGTSDPAVIDAHGDYDDWFLDAVPSWRSRCDVIDVWRGEFLPDPSRWGGALITGSPVSVRDEAPWMAAVGRWALQTARRGHPVLGVCFGHQILGELLGGRVELNPAGREIGTIEVSLTPEGRADPLFAGLPDPLVVQATHSDSLVQAPSGTTRLAGNANTPWQAFALGPRLRCVQFHPEIRAEVLRDILHARDQSAEILESDHGAKILENWDRTWVRAAPAPR